VALWASCAVDGRVREVGGDGELERPLLDGVGLEAVGPVDDIRADHAEPDVRVPELDGELVQVRFDLRRGFGHYATFLAAMNDRSATLVAVPLLALCAQRNLNEPSTVTIR
jgi:hypothetical protein